MRIAIQGAARLLATANPQGGPDAQTRNLSSVARCTSALSNGPVQVRHPLINAAATKPFYNAQYTYTGKLREPISFLNIEDEIYSSAERFAMEGEPPHTQEKFQEGWDQFGINSDYPTDSPTTKRLTKEVAQHADKPKRDSPYPTSTKTEDSKSQSWLSSGWQLWASKEQSIEEKIKEIGNQIEKLDEARAELSERKAELDKKFNALEEERKTNGAGYNLKLLLPFPVTAFALPAPFPLHRAEMEFFLKNQAPVLKERAEVESRIEQINGEITNLELTKNELQRQEAAERLSEKRGILLEARERFAKNAEQHKINHLAYHDYNLQANRICQDRGAQYSKRLKQDQGLYVNTQTSRAEYHQKLLEFLSLDIDQDTGVKKEGIQITNLQSLFNPNTFKGSTSILVDLLRYQAEHLQVTELENTIKTIFAEQTNIKQHFADEDIDKMIYAVLPVLVKLGRVEIAKKCFPKERFKHITALKEGMKDEGIYKKLKDTATHSIGAYTSQENFKKESFDSKVEKFKTHVALLSRDKASKIYKDQRNNILHDLVTSIMEIKPGEDASIELDLAKGEKMNARTTDIAQIYLYKQYLEILRDELPPKILHKLLTQRNKDGKTCMQLFFELAQDKNGKPTEQGVILLDWFVGLGYIDFPTCHTFWSGAFGTLTWLLNVVAGRLIWSAIGAPLAQLVAPTWIRSTYVWTAAIVPGVKLGAMVTDALFQTATSTVIEIARHWRGNYEKNKEEISAGQKERFCFAFHRYTPLTAAINPNGFPIGRNTISSQVAELLRNDAELGADKCIATASAFKRKAKDMTVSEKIQLYKDAALQKALLEERIKEVSAHFVQTAYQKFAILLCIMQDKRSILKKQHASTNKLIDAIVTNLNAGKRYHKLSNSINASFISLLECHDDDILTKMALEINQNKSAGIAFDQFYLMVESGMFLLRIEGYDNLIKLHEKVLLLREDAQQQSKFEEEISSDNRKKANKRPIEDTEICTKFINLQNKEFIVELPKIPTKEEIKEAKASGNTIKLEYEEHIFKLENLIESDVAEKKARDTKLPILLEKKTLFNRFAKALKAIAGIPQNITEDILNSLYSCIPSWKGAIATLGINLTLNIVEGSMSQNNTSLAQAGAEMVQQGTTGLFNFASSFFPGVSPESVISSSDKASNLVMPATKPRSVT